MRLQMDRQMSKPGKTKILKEYCLQCSAEKDRRTWERKETENRNYFNYVCLRQNNSCKQGTNLLNLSHAILLNIPHISGKLLCNTVPYTFLKKNICRCQCFHNIPRYKYYNVIDCGSSKWLKNCSTITEQQFPVKIHPSSASRRNMSVSISQAVPLHARGFCNSKRSP